MPYFHATLFFTYRTDYSWVEQFWRQSPDRASALAAAMELAAARFKIMGAGATCYRVRVCQADQPRACISAGIAGNALVPEADLPIAALEVRLVSLASTQHWRNYPLRGLPLVWFTRVGRRLQLSPAFRTQVDTWLSLLVNRQWLMQVEQALGPALPIQQINLSGLGDADIYSDPLNPDNPPEGQAVVGAILNSQPPLGGALVKVSGVRPTPDFPKLRRHINGTHPVYLTAPNAVYWIGDLGGADSATGGTVELRSLSYLPISNWNYVRRVARKCGPYREAGETSELPGLAPPPAPEGIPVPASHFRLIGAGGIVINEYRTLQDVAIEIFKGYTEPTTPTDPLVGVTRVVNTVNLEYAVFIAGVDLHIEKPSWQQYADGLLALSSAPDDYTDFVRAVIKKATPDGCTLHLFGHSLGGMSAQWMLSVFPGLGNRTVKTLVGFGTSWIVSGVSLFPFQGVATKRLFMVQNDPVVYFGPAGFAWPARAALDIYAGSLEVEVALVLGQQAVPINQTRLTGPDLPLFDLIGRHNCYPTLPDCLNYYWDGLEIPTTPGPFHPTLQTDNVDRFTYPPG